MGSIIDLDKTSCLCSEDTSKYSLILSNSRSDQAKITRLYPSYKTTKHANPNTSTNPYNHCYPYEDYLLERKGLEIISEKDENSVTNNFQSDCLNQINQFSSIKTSLYERNSERVPPRKSPIDPIELKPDIQPLYSKLSQDNYSYEGTLLEGKYHGIGRLSIPGVLTYKGEFKNGRFHGYGILEHLQKECKYEGEWANGKRNGYGVETVGEDKTYKGLFLEDLKHGYGIMDYFNGSKYTGMYRHNERSGFGKFIWDQNRCYTGGFKDGMFSGFGTLDKPSRKYVGYFEGDLQDGFGVNYDKIKNHFVIAYWRKGTVDSIALMVRFPLGSEYALIRLGSDKQIFLVQDELEKRNFRETDRYRELKAFYIKYRSLI